MRSLAETTSVTIDLFRKIAEMSLLPDVSIHSNHGNSSVIMTVHHVGLTHQLND